MNLDAIAYTTRQVLDGASICRVAYDDDGDWQIFEEGGPHRESDGRIVHLRHLAEIDPTILDLREMKIGFEAVRNEDGITWTVRRGEPLE